MDWDEKYTMNEEARVEDEFQCSYCRKWIGGFEAIDPVIIDGEPACDHCASDITYLSY